MSGGTWPTRTIRNCKQLLKGRAMSVSTERSNIVVVLLLVNWRKKHEPKIGQMSKLWFSFWCCGILIIAVFLTL